MRDFIRRIEQKIDRIIAMQERQVSIMKTVEEIVKDLDVETNKIADKLNKQAADLAAALAAGKPPSQETIAALSAISDRLAALGADPADPVPVSPSV